MPLNLIKKLYVPSGIPFDPKQYYKDGAHTRMLRRPRLWGIGEYDIHWDDGEALFTSHAWRRLFEVRLGGVRRRMTWRQFILALGLYSEEEMAKLWEGPPVYSRYMIPGLGYLRPRRGSRLFYAAVPPAAADGLMPAADDGCTGHLTAPSLAAHGFPTRDMSDLGQAMPAPP
ncbi:hypothetical protein Tco_1216275 [Tanacetum coccineum]